MTGVSFLGIPALGVWIECSATCVVLFVLPVWHVCFALSGFVAMDLGLSRMVHVMVREMVFIQSKFESYNHLLPFSFVMNAYTFLYYEIFSHTLMFRPWRYLTSVAIASTAASSSSTAL